ncbi:MAG TPA: PQQ-dependent sugar dehydrogenase [Candidatus Udaeobacter sp.]|nr:PQQ-dependent sugar dehydrogenase [Candidatus Udaeobacter sp.]
MKPQPENHMQSQSKTAATESPLPGALRRLARTCAVTTLLLTSIAPLMAAQSTYHWANLLSNVMAVTVPTANVASPEATPPVPLIPKGSVRLKLATVATGLTAPVDLTSASDGSGRLFIVQQTGQVLILQGGVVLPTPFLDLSSRLVPLMAGYDERGLLGLAFHPDFNNPSAPGYHKVYTYTSEPVDGPADFTVPDPSAFDNQSVLAEWQVSATNPNVIDPSTRREVVRIDHPQFNHNGGKLAFRATDGYLYISLGDGGNANDVGDGHTPVKGNAQDKSNVLGKLLRIDPLDPTLTRGSQDRISANGKYRVPRTNPFLDQPGAVREIYVYGLRNPFRFTFDDTLDQLIIGDVGQDNIEEIDLGVSGTNYGWHRKEGTFLFNPDDGRIKVDPNPDPRLVNPVAEYSHFDGIAVIGGFTYRGSRIPVLASRYIFGDLAGNAGSGRLFYTYLGNGSVFEFQLGQQNPLTGSFLKGFGQDDSHEIYVLIDSSIGPSGTGGQILKIVNAEDQG